MQLLLLLITLSVASSCRKAEPVEPSNTTEVYGRVLLRGTNHKATSEPCVIKAYHRYGASGVLFGSVIDQVGEGVTDTEGNFRFSFKNPPNSEYGSFYIRLETEIENHFRPNKHDYRIKLGESQQLNLEYVPFAWMRFHFRNAHPQPGDIFRTRLGTGDLIELFGPADKQYIHNVGGNTSFEFSYAVVRNGTPILYKDTLFAPAFDTTYHLIEY